MSSTIGELSLATGVPIATLRDWDRRHGLSPSQRTIGNHRRYTEDDAALVVRVRDLVAGGRRLAAAVGQARADQTAQATVSAGAGTTAARHQQLREEAAATREEFVARRDQLIAEREALVARRHLLVRQHGDTLAVLAGGITPTTRAQAATAVPETTTP